MQKISTLKKGQQFYFPGSIMVFTYLGKTKKDGFKYQALIPNASITSTHLDRMVKYMPIQVSYLHGDF